MLRDYHHLYGEVVSVAKMRDQNVVTSVLLLKLLVDNKLCWKTVSHPGLPGLCLTRPDDLVIRMQSSY